VWLAHLYPSGKKDQLEAPCSGTLIPAFLGGVPHPSHGYLLQCAGAPQSSTSKSILKIAGTL
jgi:hypothetical protein